jgi:hypothetical protein
MEEHTIITAKLESWNLAVAEIHQGSERAVQVRIQTADRWDAAGRTLLSALLGGSRRRWRRSSGSQAHVCAGAACECATDAAVSSLSAIRFRESTTVAARVVPSDLWASR